MEEKTHAIMEYLKAIRRHLRTDFRAVHGIQTNATLLTQEFMGSGEIVRGKTTSLELEKRIKGMT
jgi:hypothetical protein